MAHSALRLKLQMELQIIHPGGTELHPETKIPERICSKTSYQCANSCQSLFLTTTSPLPIDHSTPCNAGTIVLV